MLKRHSANDHHRKMSRFLKFLRKAVKRYFLRRARNNIRGKQEKHCVVCTSALAVTAA